LCEALAWAAVPWNVSSAAAYLVRIGLAATFVCMGFVLWKRRDVFLGKSQIFFGTAGFLFLVWKFSPEYVLVWCNLGEGLNRSLFPLVSLGGLYFSLFIVACAGQLGWLRRFLLLCGRKSLHIMGLHQTGFLLLNLALTALPGYKIRHITGVYSFFDGVPGACYFAAGLAFSLALCLAWDRWARRR
ncbi:MAG: hypothetical protein HUK26_09930, partial [Duodenibacillus sp.]|nr:hypothetical protein [Duodenibacillus sp.]